MTIARVIVGDARRVLADLEVEDPARTVIVTDPVWPNVPAGMFPGVEDPARLFADVAAQFPRLARRAVVQLGCTSDPRFLGGMPSAMPFVRVCWLRYATPSYLGTVLGSGDVAYVYGSYEGPEGLTVLPGECTSNDPNGKRTKDHPCPRKLEHLVWLIRNFTRTGDLVLDPFAGSGTTAIAALRAGRSFLGVEIEPRFAELVREAIAAELASTTVDAARAGQVPMFDGERPTSRTTGARVLAAKRRKKKNDAARKARPGHPIGGGQP